MLRTLSTSLASILVCGLLGTAACGSPAPSSSTDTSSDGVTTEPDLFASRESIAITLEGPFSQAFAAAAAGQPSGPLPGLPRRVYDERPATLSYTTAAGEKKTLGITFKVRGNSSVGDCRFPKMSVKFTDKAAAKASIFANNTKFKIGTHCGEGGRTYIGRLKDGRSPVRETRVARAFEAVMPDALAARPARITYVDTVSGETIERSGGLFEHPDRLAKRAGAVSEYCRQVDGAEECDPVLTDAELKAFDARQGMDRVRIATIQLMEIAVGNWDWRLDVSDTDPEDRLWNIDVLVRRSDPANEASPLEYVPVAQDFDLASIVSGKSRANDTDESRRAYIAKQLAERTAGLTEGELAAAKATLLARKDDIYARLAGDAAAEDPEGQQLARQQLDAFFATIAP